MSDGFIPVPGLDDSDIDVLTRVVSEQGQPALLPRGRSGRHELQIKNHNPGARRVKITSQHGDDRLAYDQDIDPWVIEASVGHTGSRHPVPRSHGISHPGKCQPNNGHTITVTVSVEPLLPGERLDSDPLFYQVNC